MWLHVDTSSFLLYNVASLGLYNRKHFSQVHYEHCLPPDGMVCFNMLHLMLYVTLLFFSFHICLLSSVVLLLLSCLKVARWLQQRCLNEVSVIPTYFFVCRQHMSVCFNGGLIFSMLCILFCKLVILQGIYSLSKEGVHA